MPGLLHLQDRGHIEPLRGLFTVVMGRYRDALGTEGDTGTGIVPDVLGASATYVVGRYGVTARAGFTGAATVPSGSMETGGAAALTVGAVLRAGAGGARRSTARVMRVSCKPCCASGPSSR